MNWNNLVQPLLYLSNNWISRLGVLLVTSAGILWLFLLPTYLQGHAGSAYIGILLFMALPMAFFAGLALMPLGIWLRRRRLGLKGEQTTGVGPLTWANPQVRSLAVFLGVTTMANLVIGANLSYRAVEHMESSQFCGATCHTVMKPEYTAYQQSPHSKVECVQCHIGPGASWFVQSKLSGAWQVVSVAFDLYPRPIPTPVANLRPARDTCEGCHWPDKYGGDRLKVRTHYTDEGKETKTVLLLHIGGGNLDSKGIHGAHVGQGVKIRYRHADNQRQTIPWVEYSRGNETREFWASNAKKDEAANWQTREMDCMDCHNRPSHTMQSPEVAVESAMYAREISPDLPMVRKVALDLIQKPYATTAEAHTAIPAGLEKYFKEQHADVYAKRRADIEKSGKALVDAWGRNIFPEMKVTWGTYPTFLQHEPGCFRCHDAEHKAKDGRVVEQDCSTCHELLAMEEENPKILADLGVIKN